MNVWSLSRLHYARLLGLLPSDSIQEHSSRARGPARVTRRDIGLLQLKYIIRSKDLVSLTENVLILFYTTLVSAAYSNALPSRARPPESYSASQLIAPVTLRQDEKPLMFL